MLPQNRLGKIHLLSFFLSSFFFKKKGKKVKVTEVLYALQARAVLLAYRWQSFAEK